MNELGGRGFAVFRNKLAFGVFLMLVSISLAQAVTVEFTSSGSWTAPAGVGSVAVEVWGGGGAGGGATGNPAKGGGGAGGQYARKVVTVTPGDSYAIVVGSGGVGDTNDGANGGDSSFATNVVVAKGGAGGSGAVNGAAGVGSSSGGVGDVVYAGGSGSSANRTTGAGGAGGGGAGSSGAGGAASGLTGGSGTQNGGGDGGDGLTSRASGNAGGFAGGGGSGGYATNNTDRNGGNGGAGQVVITYNLPCTPPSNTSGVALTCVCDNFGRASLNPSTIFGSNWALSNSDGISNPSINSTTGLLRLTENTNYNAKAATVPSLFPAAGNFISVEFMHYAYRGTTTGADGIAVTLSDYSIPAVPGGFGGSLGYAQRSDGVKPPGFAGGWIGVALDEYGNYQNPTEGRVNPPSTGGFISQSVGVRGPGSGANGYRWMTGTSSIPGGLRVDSTDRTSTTPAPGYMYQVIVDARDYANGTVNVSVNRDATTKDGSTYASLFSPFNAYTEASYAQSQGWISKLVPDYWKISFTGSTGASNNIHEIGSLRICAQTVLPPTGGSASGFSAVDDAYPGAPTVPVYDYFNTGHIYMKLTGVPFSLWVAALQTTPAPGISTSYSATNNKYVQVKLVDNSDNVCGTDSVRTCNSACTNKAAVETGSGATQIATFVSGNLTGVASPKPTFTLNSAYKNLIAVMKECTTSTCTAFTATAAACSVDSFSVRPLSVASVTSVETSTGAGNAATNTATSGTPVFNAGSSNFALRAITTGVTGYPSGYTGTLKIDNSRLAVVGPATEVGNIAPAVFPAATSGASSSTATGTTFTYSEVGAFLFRGYDPSVDTTSPRGVYDGVRSATECNGLTVSQCDTIKSATWTGVDSVSTAGECVPDSYSNAKVDGKYGCNFGITGNTSGFGRFIPDHFGLAGSVLNRSDLASPGGTFSYMDEPMKATLVVTAYAAGETITKNYAGNLAKLDSATLGTGSNWFNTGCTESTQCFGLGAINVVTNPDGTTTASGLSGRLAINTAVENPSSSWAAGVGTFVAHVALVRNTAPDGPYETLRVGGMPRDSDGVTLPGPASSDTHKVDLDATTGNTLSSNPDGTNERRLLFTTKSRFGRLWLGNAYGTDRNALSIPYQFQYWNGSAFVRNPDDSLSSLLVGNIGLGNYQGALYYTASTPPASAKGVVSNVSSINADLTFIGSGTITVPAPTLLGANTGAAGSVDLVVDLGSTSTTNNTWVPNLPTAGPTGRNLSYLRGKWYGTTWDRDPTARATFGIFGSSLRKGPIYIRENF